MKIIKKRANGKGTVILLKGDRSKPYVARFCVSIDINGLPIYLDVDSFENELDALVF